jgi:aryl-alcohol dehydrogenase-like predicted oxidoreductase
LQLRSHEQTVSAAIYVDGMETRQIGGLTVSVVGLGCNNFGTRLDEGKTADVVKAAVDAGITLFDTADVYGGTKSEEFLGKALAGVRDDVVIATKFGAMTGAKPEDVKSACEDSLRRLGTDRIDLYQIHRPHDDTPIEDTLGAMNELVREGKVLEIGCSNFDSARMAAAAAAAKEKDTAAFVTVQNQINLVDRRQEADTVAGCASNALSILPYFPLASGMLTGKYRRGEPPPAGTRLSQLPEDRLLRAFDDRVFDVVEGLEAFATERGHSLLELAMSWLAGMPYMGSVIAGATTPEQIKTNVDSVNWKLTDDERATIDELSRR